MVMHIKRPQRFAVIVIALAMVLAFSPRLALAHAVLLSSTPQKNVTVSGPEIAISLKYNSRVDGARSTLSLLKPDGTVETVGGLTQPHPDELSATGHGLAKGAYLLRGQLLSKNRRVPRVD